jgi:hypothetical protein
MPFRTWPVRSTFPLPLPFSLFLSLSISLFLSTPRQALSLPSLPRRLWIRCRSLKRRLHEKARHSTLVLLYSPPLSISIHYTFYSQSLGSVQRVLLWGFVSVLLCCECYEWCVVSVLLCCECYEWCVVSVLLCCECCDCWSVVSLSSMLQNQGISSCCVIPGSWLLHKLHFWVIVCVLCECCVCVVWELCVYCVCVVWVLCVCCVRVVCVLCVCCVCLIVESACCECCESARVWAC